MPDELWREFCNTVQETGIKTTSKKKKCKNAEWLSEEALQMAEKRREIEENNRMGKTRDLFKKIRDTKEYFMQRWAQLRTEMVWT